MALEKNLGVKPHVVISNIARIRVDVNRDPCTTKGFGCACTEADVDCNEKVPTKYEHTSQKGYQI